MDANQRSEINNQTNNGANEKWTPGSKGKTTSGPNDHTYPRGATQQQGQQGGGEMGTQQSGMGPGRPTAGDISDQRNEQEKEQGGSMQTQQTGGSGPVQGITDSHQRAMEERSPAYGKLEQPVGDRAAGSRQSGNTQATVDMNPQNVHQPELQGGALGRHDVPHATDERAGQHMNQPATRQMAPNGELPPPAGQSMQRDPRLQSDDRKGSQTGDYPPDNGVHKSNDSSGGLPRSPGNSGPWPQPRTTHLTGAQNEADLQRPDIGVHQSNDMRGGYPRSPGGANKLAADEKMDDDTGFSNPGR